MSYYRMKCIYCGQRLDNESVVYRVSSDDLTLIDMPSEGGAESTEFNNSVFQKQSTLDMSAGANNSLDIRYMTCREIEAVENVECERITKQVKVNTDDHENVIEPDAELVQGIDIKRITLNGASYSGKLRKRRCCACHKLLPALEGEIPTFTVGIIGHSRAGKTMYLMMQYFYFMTNLKPATCMGTVYPYLSIEHLEGEDDTIQTLYGKFIKNHIIPSTTQTDLTTPHCLQLEYRCKGSSVTTSACLLAIRDAMGEVYTRTDIHDPQLKKVAEACKSSDALYIMLDPNALPATERLSAEAKNDSTVGRPEIATLKQVIHSLITDFGEKSKPNVIFLAKEDMLVRYAEVLNTDPSAPALATGFHSTFDSKENWYEQFWHVLNESTKEQIAILDFAGEPASSGIAEFLDGQFTESAYIPVSSTGTDVQFNKWVSWTLYPPAGINAQPQTGKCEVSQVRQPYETFKANNRRPLYHPNGASLTFGDDETILEPFQLMKPRFIELPAMYLLMKFHIIPPIHEAQFYNDPKESFKSWYKTYAQNREDQNAVFKEADAYWASEETSEEQEKTAAPKKKGLFGGHRK